MSINLLCTNEIKIIKTLLNLDLAEVTSNSEGVTFLFIGDNTDTELTITVGKDETELFIYIDNSFEETYGFLGIMTTYDLTNTIIDTIFNYFNSDESDDTRVSILKNHLAMQSLFIHNKSHDVYSLKQVTNATATKDGFVTTCVFVKIATQEAFSRPMEEFRVKFTSVEL